MSPTENYARTLIGVMELNFERNGLDWPYAESLMERIERLLWPGLAREAGEAEYQSWLKQALPPPPPNP